MLEVKRGQLNVSSHRESRLPRELTIFLDLLIEIVDINSVVGASLRNCHGVRCSGTALSGKKGDFSPAFTQIFCSRGLMGSAQESVFQEEVGLDRNGTRMAQLGNKASIGLRFSSPRAKGYLEKLTTNPRMLH